MAGRKFEWTFVNIKLTAEDRPALEKYAKEHKLDITSALTAVASYGYKTSISFIDDSNSWVVSVSGTDRSKNNNKHTMTSWSDDLAEAIFMAAFKCDIVTKGEDWSEFAEESSNWG